MRDRWPGGPKRTLVVGLGNPLLGDDAVGLRVAQALAHRLAGVEGVEVVEDYHGGLRLMERMIGFDRVVVIDALGVGESPGRIHRLQPDGRPTRRSASSHDLDLTMALALGRRAGADLPVDEAIHLIGIEAAEVETFGESLTPGVAEAVPRAVDLVLHLITMPTEGP